MTGKMLLAVATGGAAGSVARYVSMSLIDRWMGTGFPWGTLAVNVLGSFVMGVLVEAAAQRWSMSQELRALLFVGVLGGFTTFSTFSLDLYMLVERQALAAAAVYGAVSVALGFTGLLAGLYVARWGFA